MQLTSLKVSTYADYEHEPHFIKSNIFDFAPGIDSKQSVHLSRLYTAVFVVRMAIASTLGYRVSAHENAMLRLSGRKGDLSLPCRHRQIVWFSFTSSSTCDLTLKAPSIICSRRQFQILLLFQK